MGILIFTWGEGSHNGSILKWWRFVSAAHFVVRVLLVQSMYVQRNSRVSKVRLVPLTGAPIKHETVPEGFNQENESYYYTPCVAMYLIWYAFSHVASLRRCVDQTVVPIARLADTAGAHRGKGDARAVATKQNWQPQSRPAGKTPCLASITDVTRPELQNFEVFWDVFGVGLAVLWGM